MIKSLIFPLYLLHVLRQVVREKYLESLTVICIMRKPVAISFTCTKQEEKILHFFEVTFLLLSDMEPF